MNFFGSKQMGMKRNPLAALMQPNLMELLAGGDQPTNMPKPVNVEPGPALSVAGASPTMLGGGDPPIQRPVQQPSVAPTNEPSALPTVGGKPLFIPGAKTEVSPAVAEQLYKQFQSEVSPKPAAPQGGGLKEFMTSPMWGDQPMLMNKREQGALYDWLNTPQWFVPPKGGHYSQVLGEKMKAAPQEAADGTSAPVEPEASNPMDQILTSDEKEKNGNLAFGGGMVKEAMGATSELLQKYGQMAQSLEGAKAALKKEFQDTPELDAIIAETQSELAKTRANRKQPGIGEFLTMALMNLSGMNPRQSADLVLGLSNQKGDEMRLEDRLAQLEGSRAGAKMHGRQALRGMQQQEKYQALQNMMRQQEIGRKQKNEDRDFALKAQGQSSGLLRALAGQEANIIQSSMDKDAVKNATNSRAKLKKLLNVDDAGLDNFIRQQQQQQKPKDERQSRMFGDMLGGGGYA